MDDVDRRLRLERLFSDHGAAVRAYARRRVVMAAAHDVVSEVFVVAWRRMDDVAEDALPWLFACAQRIVANQRRASRRRPLRRFAHNTALYDLQWSDSGSDLVALAGPFTGGSGTLSLINPVDGRQQILATGITSFATTPQRGRRATRARYRNNESIETVIDC